MRTTDRTDLEMMAFIVIVALMVMLAVLVAG
jgi:hypothetical protein